VAAAQATLENARLQYQRAVSLVKNQNIPQATVDQRKAEQDTAEASLLQTQAAQRLAEINLGYTDIYASVAGKIGRASVSVGNLVQPSTGVLATIVSQDPIYVTFPVSQRLVLEFRRRQAEQGAASGPDAVAVHLTLADGSQYPQTGKIDFIDNQVDQATDSVTVRAVFPNPQGVLVAGQVATVGAAADQGTRSIVVPQAALQLDQAGSFVMVVGEGDKVEARRVKTGATQGVNTEILEGLKDGDKVIVEGLLKVRPGMVVQVTEAPKAAGA
jgi:membrane fusion protein (multidrug efflux system)